MGAIYGIVGEADAHHLKQMSARIVHRGSHRGEAQVSPRCWLGQRAAELDSGPYSDGHRSVVADATLYNLAELRAELELNGYRFTTGGAHEVILAAYASFGQQCFERFKGPFAIALWDAQAQTLTLTRDPLGLRLLFYWHGQGQERGSRQVVFASEYKALLALDEVPAIPNLDHLQQLQYTKSPPTNSTLLEGIVAVPPAHAVRFNGGPPAARRFWRPALDLRQRSEAETARLVREHLRRAVERCVGDADPIGLNLSSGIDSTAVLASLRQAFPDRSIHTFTGGHGPDDPEMQGAALAAEHCGSIHHPVVINPERLPDIMPGLVWHLEDPIARSEVVFYYELSKVAARHTRVVLNGHGGDTIFAGMDKYKLLRLMEWCPPLKGPLTEFLDYTQVSAPPRSIPGRALTNLYFRGAEPAPPRIVGSDWQPPRSAFAGADAELINRYLVASFEDGFHDAYKIERPQVAHGVEVAYPLLDLDLVTLAFQIPERYKLRRWREKHILREAVRPLLPKVVLEKPKFPARLASDLSFSAVLESCARAVLSPAAVADRGFFRPAEIDRLLRREARRPYPYGHAMRIWTVLLTELWAQRFIDQRGAPPDLPAAARTEPFTGRIPAIL